MVDKGSVTGKDTDTEVPATSSVDQLFDEARDWLRTKFSVKAALELFNGELSEGTIKRLRGTKYNRFKPLYRAMLVKVYKPEKVETFYDQVAFLLDQERSQKSEILKRYEGEYKYYRYASPKGDSLVYVSGRIKIFEDNEGNPAFQHWSATYLARAKKERDPQHTGYVFVQENRLFMMGVGEGTLRLSICETFKKNARANSVLHGIVVSTRSSPRDPFGARFILVHADNGEAQSRLDPGNPDGEKNFHQDSIWDQAHYLKIH